MVTQIPPHWANTNLAKIVIKGHVSAFICWMAPAQKHWVSRSEMLHFYTISYGCCSLFWCVRLNTYLSSPNSARNLASFSTAGNLFYPQTKASLKSSFDRKEWWELHTGREPLDIFTQQPDNTLMLTMKGSLMWAALTWEGGGEEWRKAITLKKRESAVSVPAQSSISSEHGANLMGLVVIRLPLI